MDILIFLGIIAAIYTSFYILILFWIVKGAAERYHSNGNGLLDDQIDIEVEVPEFSCPHIARTELWLQEKLSKEDFKELEKRMDEIRKINHGLRDYARYWKRKVKKDED